MIKTNKHIIFGIGSNLNSLASFLVPVSIKKHCMTKLIFHVVLFYSMNQSNRKRRFYELCNEIIPGKIKKVQGKSVGSIILGCIHIFGPLPFEVQKQNLYVCV